MRPSYAAARDRRMPPRPAPARGASVPPPIEGWDAMSPVQAMSPKRAITLENWFPQLSWVELRRGSKRHASLIGTTDAVETLASYQGASGSALFAAAGTDIYDVTGGGASPSTLGSLTNARWQFCNFAGTGGNFLYMVNGADTPIYYDGATFTAAVITGTGITPEDFITVTPHKGRLWFTINESSNAAYLVPDAIQGTAVKFPVGGNWSLGGHLVTIGSWSLDGGSGPEDYIAFFSSMGQVSVYSGIDPASDFALVGTYYIGPPIGRRCLTKVGADLAVVSIDGVVPLSKALIFDRAAIPKVAITTLIQRVMNQSARDFKGNFGWQGISYPRGTRYILNVPTVENETQEQYVMNTLSGAWCRFLGQNAACWELFDDDLYFGGNEGVVFQADIGATDANETIHYDMKCAFNYVGAKGINKRFTMCRPLLTTDQQVQPGIAFNVDFQDNAPINTQATVVSPGGIWDQSLWDQALWAGGIVTQSNWTSVSGIGYCASIRMVVDVVGTGSDAAFWGIGLWGIDTWGSEVGSNVTLQVNGFDLLYEKGAFV